MTKVWVYKEGNYITHFKLIGHAGYSSQGTDIVCAAISMATQMTVQGAQLISEDMVEGYLDTPGFMIIKFNYPKDIRIVTLANTLEFALRSLSEQYPENIRIYSD